MSGFLTIRNNESELRRMSQWLRDSARAASIPEELVFPLDVCANEVVGNIMSYAYEDAAAHEISLELAATPKGARLVIRDDGRPFNPLDEPEPQHPASLAEAQIGGLGIPIVRRMMAHCEYRREQRNNVLTLEAHSAGKACDA
jgi:serine/threonine-protein kinase RsbW